MLKIFSFIHVLNESTDYTKQSKEWGKEGWMDGKRLTVIIINNRKYDCKSNNNNKIDLFLCVNIHFLYIYD